jgi:hypothetical protein
MKNRCLPILHKKLLRALRVSNESRIIGRVGGEIRKESPDEGC